MVGCIQVMPVLFFPMVPKCMCDLYYIHYVHIFIFPLEDTNRRERKHAERWCNMSHRKMFIISLIKNRLHCMEYRFNPSEPRL